MSAPRRALVPTGVLVALAWAAAPAPAQVASLPARAPVTWQSWGRPLEARGWTTDGRHFVYTKRVEYWPMETIEDEGVRPMSLLFGITIEARTGRERRWVLELTQDGQAAQRRELSDEPGPSDFKAWLQEHPLVLRQGRGGGVATATVDAKDAEASASVRWARGGAEIDMPGKRAVRLRLGVEAEGRKWLSLEINDNQGPLAGRATPYWSPDGQRVAWMWAQRTDAGQGPTDYVVLAAAGPRVEVVVTAVARPASPNVFQHLEEAGVAPLALRVAAAVTPEHTIIRYGRGHDEDARVLADRLSGGAVVEPMVHASTFDLSVEPGAELFMPPAPPFEELEEWVAGPARAYTAPRAGDWRLGLVVGFGAALLLALVPVVLARRR